MMRTGRSGDQQSPLRVLRITARETDWEQVRGLHQGQRPSAPHQRAGHMTAIGQPASALIKTLACRGRPHRTLSLQLRAAVGGLNVVDRWVLRARGFEC